VEARTSLDGLEARGTLGLALKVAGFLTRDVGRDDLALTLRTIMPGELRARGVENAERICEEVRAALGEAR
jgi:hypothetical protein